MNCDVVETKGLNIAPLCKIRQTEGAPDGPPTIKGL